MHLSSAEPSENVQPAERAKRKRSKEERREAKRLKLQRRQNAVPDSAVGDFTEKLKTETDGNDLNAMDNYEEVPSLRALPQRQIDDFFQGNGISIQDVNASSPLRPIIDFSHLSESMFSNRSAFENFKAPTPIQAAAWPFLLSGRDVVGVAETGSGKTLAFGVPLVRAVLASKSQNPSKPSVRAVVVSPTRELAQQIYSQLKSLARPYSLHTVCIYGGVQKDDQRKALVKANIIVATPGRLKDFIEEGCADLSHTRYLVLDEADRMLDKGFEDDIRNILSFTPSTGRQTLMFTATWPPSIRELASTFMLDPVRITIGVDNPSGDLRANKSITQVVEVIDPGRKQLRLIELLKKHQGAKGKTSRNRILIFTLYKKEAARIESFLSSRSFHVAAIHGDMSQAARTSSLEGFKTGTCPLLVATDVAARGLDIPEVEVVINLTFPLTVEDYVHRIGRTGRAGRSGLAVTLFTEHDKALAGGLINVLRAAGQTVPEDLLRFGTTVKKKGHDAYGAFFKEAKPGEKTQGTKIRF